MALLERAREKKIPMIPLQISDGEVPSSLAELRAVSIEEGDQIVLEDQDVLDELEWGITGKKPKRPETDLTALSSS
jgi:hypothetical protein